MLENINKALKKLETNKYNKIADNVLKMVEKEDSSEDHLLALKNQKDNYNVTKALYHISKLSQRYFGLTPYKSQLKAALVLDSGQVAELATGEGKTLSVVIATLLNYIKGGKTHIVTANEYLVERDFEFSKALFEDLGMKTALLGVEKTMEEKIGNYSIDVLYSTSKGLVFDYLNNNKVRFKEMAFDEVYDMVIIDEIDFVLIDEARTPIIISGSVETDVEKYKLFNDIQKDFKGYKKKPDELELPEDVDFIQGQHSIELTDQGYQKLELELKSRGVMTEAENIFDGEGFSYISYMKQSLRAVHLLKENIDYIMTEDHGIVLINPQTGRPQPGRRFSEGVHQALEAFKGVEVQQDSKVTGQTTLQNFLKKYNKLAGTTGTASTEEIEFKEFYSLKVLPIAPNKPSKRKDLNDILFYSDKERNASILLKIKENLEDGRPTLLGTQTLEASEVVAKLLDENNIKYNLLNAKNHEKEAYVIANAGKTGAITIATNMAGRGTDIMLGGNKDYEIQRLQEEGLSDQEAVAQWESQNKAVVESGGLSIIGVSRGFSRRLDNQLIGRSGRQGDQGETQFYLSLEDDLFGGMSLDYLKSNWSKENQDQGLTFGFLTKVVREAQKNVEGQSFNQRKNLFKFDSVNSEQREIFYEWRKKVLDRTDYSSIISNYHTLAVKNIVISNLEAEEFFANDLTNMESDFEKILGKKVDIRAMSKEHDLEDEDDVVDFISNVLIDAYNEKMKVLSSEEKSYIEKEHLLKAMDENYAENISNLETMRSSTSLRSYAQKNPLDEYQQEALEMFSNLVKDVKSDVVVGLINFNPEAFLDHKRKMEELQRNMALNESEPQKEKAVQASENVTKNNDSTLKEVDKLFTYNTSIGV